MTFFITFTCYGCHLHGEESGSVSRGRNLFGSRRLEGDPKRVSAEQQRMVQAPYNMDRSRRDAVLSALQQRSAQSVTGPYGPPTYAPIMCT